MKKLTLIILIFSGCTFVRKGTYKYTIKLSEGKTIRCSDYSQQYCGLNLYDCKDGASEYKCMQNVGVIK